MEFLLAIFAVVIGLLFAFGGWRFFLLLLPLWGLLVGFNVGTEAVVALFGEGTFATVTSWVVGLVLAVVFALFSYLYYYAAIALLGGSIGYVLGAGAWGLIGNEHGPIALVIGLVVGAVFAFGILVLNVPRYLVIVLTALGGAAAVMLGWFLLTGAIPADEITWVKVGSLILDNVIALVIWGVVAAAGILAQLAAPKVGPDAYELEKGSYRYS